MQKLYYFVIQLGKYGRNSTLIGLFGQLSTCTQDLKSLKGETSYMESIRDVPMNPKEWGLKRRGNINHYPPTNTEHLPYARPSSRGFSVRVNKVHPHGAYILLAGDKK